MDMKYDKFYRAYHKMKTWTKKAFDHKKDLSIICILKIHNNGVVEYAQTKRKAPGWPQAH